MATTTLVRGMKRMDLSGTKVLPTISPTFFTLTQSDPVVI